MADYDFGGWLQGGMATARNTTGAPEPVINVAGWCTCSHTIGYEVDPGGTNSLRPVPVRRGGTGCPVHGNT